MWIIRFHLIGAKEYNKITRIFQRYGCSFRYGAPVVYGKATVLHVVQKRSWRSLKKEFGIPHVNLYRFYEFASSTEMIREIFYVFIECQALLYIGDKTQVSLRDMGNTEQYIDLTYRELENML